MHRAPLLAGRYHPGRAIAEGATSVVQEATHAVTGQRVALKVAHSGAASRARFSREARALGAIRHGHVVTVHDAGELADGQAFLALELLPGRTLDAVLATRGKLSPAHAAAIGVQLGEALAAAHACGVLHRDVRPGNVMVVTNDAGEEIVKLIDFGSAAHLSEASAEDDLAPPEYLPLERLDDHRELDIRSDVFSLAVTLYELVTGDVPALGTRAELLAHRTTYEAPRLEEIGVPPALAAVIARGLARDLADRTPSGRAFARALSPFAGGPHPRLLPSSVADVTDVDAGDVVELADDVGERPPPLPGARRKFARAAWVTPVRIVHEHGETSGVSEDVSAGGMLVVASRKFPNCTHARVCFRPPGHDGEVELEAAVRWVRDTRKGTAFGVEFVDAPASVREAIAACVAATAKS